MRFAAQALQRDCPYAIHDSEVLPFIYNARKNLFKKGIDPIRVGAKMIHFTGGAKPWWKEGSSFLPLTGKYARYQHLHDLWKKENTTFITQYGFDPMDYAPPVKNP